MLKDFSWRFSNDRDSLPKPMKTARSSLVAQAAGSLTIACLCRKRLGWAAHRQENASSTRQFSWTPCFDASTCSLKIAGFLTLLPVPCGETPQVEAACYQKAQESSWESAELEQNLPSAGHQPPISAGWQRFLLVRLSAAQQRCHRMARNS